MRWEDETEMRSGKEEEGTQENTRKHKQTQTSTHAQDTSLVSGKTGSFRGDRQTGDR